MLFRKQKENETEYEPAEEAEEITVSREHGSSCIVISIVMELLLGLLTFIKISVDSIPFLTALVPLLLITALLGTYLYNHDADMKMFMSFSVLTALGMALQVLIDHVYHPLTTFSPLKTGIALAVAVVFVLLYKLFRMILNRSFTVYLMIAASIGLYVCLYLYGIDPNGYGTNAWIQVGSYTLQLTDFSKVIAIMFYSALFSSKTSRKDGEILLLSNIFFLVNLAGSVLIHELGSFFVLYFLHVSILFIFMGKGKAKTVYLTLLVAGTAAAFAGAFGLYHLLAPQAEAGTLNSITAVLWPIVNKIHTRFSLTANLNNDPYGAGYQLLQGKKALWMAGLFGNTVNFSALPVPESDMAFISLVSSFGFVFGFLAVILFLIIMISGAELSRRLAENDLQDSVVSFGAASLLFLQAMLVILGSCNVIPFAGLPIPFLSRGGTYQMIAFCFAGLLLRMSENNGTGYLKEGDLLEQHEPEQPEVVPEPDQTV